jgi:hypothetical protein
MSLIIPTAADIKVTAADIDAQEDMMTMFVNMPTNFDQPKQLAGSFKSRVSKGSADEAINDLFKRHRQLD